jgi:uncharacterized protein YecE (DUF72 family)
MANACEVRIGCSGWHYKHWVGRFYPEKTPASKMLDYYLQYFDTVELNNSFYKLPTVESFQCWKDATPRDFRYAVKASRFITHNKKLKDPENALENFLPRAEALGRKLGPILFQLPPQWRINEERFEQFLSALPRYHRYTFEFREPSWESPRIRELLHRHNAAYCIFELAGYHTPLHITADWTYVRLHGPTQNKYQGSYTNEQLRQWAVRIADWSTRLKHIYIYFDNDDSAYAAFNAIELKKLVAAELGLVAA